VEERPLRRSAVPYLLGQLGVFKRPRTISASSANTAQSRLRNDLRIAYGFGPGATSVVCPILMQSVVSEFVGCAHLVPRQLREVWPELGIVNELRNVLLMFRSIEEAYDDFVLSLLWAGVQDSDGRDLYRVHVWDPTLRALPVTVNVRRRDAPRFGGVVIPTLDAITFDELHGQLRMLASRSGHAPYRRSLAFQAQLARAKALFSGWDVVEVDMDAAVTPDISPDKMDSLIAWRDVADSQAEVV